MELVLTRNELPIGLYRCREVCCVGWHLWPDVVAWSSLLSNPTPIILPGQERPSALRHCQPAALHCAACLRSPLCPLWRECAGTSCQS